MFGQLERCPETSKLHLQSIWDPREIFLKSCKAADALRRSLPPIFSHPHITVTRNLSQAIAYVTKEESRVSGPFGQPPSPDCRLGLLASRLRDPSRSSTLLPVHKRSNTSINPIAAARNGTSLDCFLDENPSCWRSIGALTAIWGRFAPPPVRASFIKRTVIFIFGPPGLGKTTLARSMLRNPLVCTTRQPYLPSNYTSKHDLIFDDVQFVRDSEFFQFLLACMHDHTVNHRILHGSVLLQHQNVILTSNTDLTSMCDKITDMDSNRFIAFRRRITHIIHLRPPTQPGFKFEYTAQRNVFDSTTQSFRMEPLC